MGWAAGSQQRFLLLPGRALLAAEEEACWEAAYSTSRPWAWAWDRDRDGLAFWFAYPWASSSGGLEITALGRERRHISMAASGPEAHMPRRGLGEARQVCFQSSIFSCVWLFGPKQSFCCISFYLGNALMFEIIIKRKNV